MMTYEDGYQNGLKIALMAIHKMQCDSKKAEFLETVINSAIAESEKRQEKYLKEMEKKQNERLKEILTNMEVEQNEVT